jgi:ribose transport system permease protein
VRDPDRGYDADVAPGRSAVRGDFGSVRTVVSGALNGGYAIWLAVIVLLASAGLKYPAVLSPDNFEELMRSMSILGIVAVGQTLVIAAGGMDLSVGMVMGLVTVLTNGIMNGDPNLALPVSLGALVLGLGIGAVNGSLIALLRIHPLILTFGMFSILEGVIFVYTDRTIGRSAANFQQIAYGSIGPLPISFIIMIFAGVVAWVLLNRTMFGRHVLALGGSEEYARRHGISTRRLKVAVYAVSGLSASLGGIVLASRLTAGYPLAGQGFVLDPIVAVVIGGTGFAGGRGAVLGSLGGALLLVLLNNTLNLNEVSPYVQQLVKGFVITVAVVLYARPRRP